MLRRISEKVWIWSLGATLLLHGIFYIVSHIYPFSQNLVYFSISEGVPAVTPSLIASEFTAQLSRTISHWDWTEAVFIALALLIYFVLGWLMARRAGFVKTGLLAGLWAGLFYGLLILILTAVQTLQLLLSYTSTSQDSLAQRMKAYTFALILTDNSSSFLLSFVLFGLLTGLLGGLCGGLMGKGKRLRVPPGASFSQQQGA